MKSIIIGVDTGNRCIKTINCSFVAGLKENSSKPAILGEFLEYRDKYYSLTNDRLPYLENKSESEDYFILTLFAIAKELLHRQVPTNSPLNISLAVGLPPSHIGRLRTSFVNYFNRNRVHFKYNGVEFNLNITTVTLYPQGYAAIISRFEDIRSLPKAYIVDIGGYTTDVILLNKGIPDMSFCESFSYGVIDLYNIIKRKIGAEYGRVPDEEQIDHVLETGEELYKNMSSQIKQYASIYADNLLRKLNELGVDLVLGHGIFIGGGSVRLKEYLLRSKYVSRNIFIPNINANAEGYELLAKNIA